MLTCSIREAIQKAHFDFVNNIFQVSAGPVGSRIFPHLQKTETFTECKRIGNVVVLVAIIQDLANRLKYVLQSIRLRCPAFILVHITSRVQRLY